MSFMQKFNQNTGSNKDTSVPVGVNLAHTSFGYQSQQGTYNPSFQTQNQPKIDNTSQHRKGRPGGGWDDDDDKQLSLNLGNTTSGSNKPIFGSNTTNTTNNTQNNLTQSTSIKTNNTNSNSTSTISKSTTADLELIAVDESFLQSREYEHKLVLDTIQLGGARLKQADTVLNSFVKAAETLNVSVVSSIIISKLRSDLPFVSKARAIYDIETLVKKLGKYFEFFKYNLATLKGFDFSLTDNNPSNVSQLNTILQSVIKYIEDPQSATKPTVQNQPYTPNVKSDTNLLEIDESENATQKKIDAFNFIKPNQTASTAEQSNEKKTNAFGFISKGTTSEQAQPKKDAFNFIKGGPTQNAGNSPTTTFPSQNTTTTPNILGLYGNSGNQQTNQLGGLNSINFNISQPVQQKQIPQQGGFGNGYNQQYGGGYNQQYGGGFNGQIGGAFNQQYGGGFYNQNAGVSYNYNKGNNLDDLAKNYQGLETQLTNMNVWEIPNADEDKKKKQQQQEQEDKLFNFVKF